MRTLKTILWATYGILISLTGIVVVLCGGILGFASEACYWLSRRMRDSAWGLRKWLGLLRSNS